MQAVKPTVVTCPGCGLSRAMDLSRLPDDVHQLVCPKCRRQFELRFATADGEDRFYRIRKRPPRSRARKKIRPTVSPAPGAKKTPPPPERKTPPPFEPEPEEGLAFIIDEESAADQDSDSTSIAFSTAPLSPPALLDGVPWENKGSFLARYILTALKILFSPKSFFKAMSLGQGYKQPRKFAVSTITIVGLVWVVQLVIFNLSYGETPLTNLAPMLIVPVIILPIVYGILIFFQAGLFHFLLKAFKVVEGGYQATFRLVAYAAVAKLWLTAPKDWMFVPIAWTAILYYVGIKGIAGKNPGIAGIILCSLMAAVEIFGLSNAWSYLLYFDFLRLW